MDENNIHTKWRKEHATSELFMCISLTLKMHLLSDSQTKIIILSQHGSLIIVCIPCSIHFTLHHP